jgi:hypothetical protein
MKRNAMSVLATSLTVLVVGLLAAAPAAPEAPGAEPRVEMVLEVDGKPVTVELDQPFTVQVGGRAVPMRLTVRPDRQFDKAGIRFRYPRAFTFAFDHNESGVDTWTMRGGSASLFLMRFPGKHDPETLLTQMTDSMAKRFDAQRVKLGDAKLTLKGRTLAGKRLEAKLANQAIRQDFYTFDGPDNSFILLVQDQHRPDAQASDEVGGVLDLLSKSLELPAAKENE